MTLQAIQAAIKTELNNVVNLAPVKRVMWGEIAPNRFESPCVLFEKESANANGMKVVSGAQIGRDIVYTVTPMYTAAEGPLSVENSESFVNEIYRRLQRESAPSRRLSGNCLDIGCTDIRYGKIGIDLAGESIMLYGGVIRLVVRVLETDAQT